MKKHFFLVSLLSFLLWSFSGSALCAVLLDRVVAVVNKEVVTWSELYKMMDNEASEQMKSLPEEERIKVFRNSEAMFLEKLIDFRLQLQEAKRLGMNVSQEEIKEAVENIKTKYSMTDKTLEENLLKEGISMDEYKRILAEQILVSQYINRLIRSKIVVTDQEIKTYSEENKDALIQNESYKLKQIFLKKPQEESGIKAVEEKAAVIVQKLKNGEDFVQVAKEFSEDPSGQQGGDLGVVRKTLLAKEFIDAISAIKPGEITRPFWTDKGLHIIKLDAATAPRNTEELKEIISRQIADQKFLEKYRSLIKDLREKAHIEIRL